MPLITKNYPNLDVSGSALRLTSGSHHLKVCAQTATTGALSGSQPFSECEAQIEISLLRSTDNKGWATLNCTVPFSQTSTSQLQHNLTSKDWHTARILWMDKERASAHHFVKHFHNYFKHTVFSSGGPRETARAEKFQLVHCFSSSCSGYRLIEFHISPWWRNFTEMSKQHFYVWIVHVHVQKNYFSSCTNTLTAGASVYTVQLRHRRSLASEKKAGQ